ncbi:MAG: YciI family protein [Planctomycetota bacterium]|nr:YciI family protein [Planctomycetota bacterium]
MRYLLLIYSDESVYPTMSEEDMGKLMAEYGEFTQALETSGVMVGADRLQPTHTATTVRIRDGETLTTDGPFAETKEQFGGYYTVDVENLDDAIAWAAKIPTSKYGSIEVRPIWEESENA